MINNLNRDLFMTFMKIGGLTIGGGPVMVPMMQRVIVEEKKWLSKDEFLDIYAVSQATPGIFAVDMASHIGYKLGGVRSGIWASLGMVAPSLVCILAIAMVFGQFRDNHYVEAAFKVIRPGVVALLCIPVFTMARNAKLTWTNAWIPVASALLIWLMGVSPVFIILIAGLAGFLLGNKTTKQQK